MTNRLPFASGTTSHSFDVVVVGAGVAGTAAALALGRRGVSTLLLEQFQVGHVRGSSHGGSRIIRYAHPDPAYAAIMPEIFSRWRELEQQCGESLLSLCGGLYAAEAGDAFLRGSMDTLARLGMPFERFSSAELRLRYPQFQLRSGEMAFVEPNAGVIAATRAVLAMAHLARRLGVVIREGCRLRSLATVGDGVEIEVESAGAVERVSAARVILAAGPWAPRLLRDLIGRPLPLRVTHQQVAYFRVTRPEIWVPERCPVYIFTADPHVYGFPVFERPGLIKVAQELFDIEVDPDDERAPLKDAAAALATTVSERLMGVDPAPVHVESCLYTETPTRDFVIDRHPDYPQIVFAAGFSGRGFKFGIGMGDLLAFLALAAPDDYENSFWLPRFALRNYLAIAPDAAAHDIFRPSQAS